MPSLPSEEDSQFHFLESGPYAGEYPSSLFSAQYRVYFGIPVIDFMDHRLNGLKNKKDTPIKVKRSKVNSIFLFTSFKAVRHRCDISCGFLLLTKNQNKVEQGYQFYKIKRIIYSNMLKIRNQNSKFPFLFRTIMGFRIMTWSTQVFPHTVVFPSFPWMKSIDFSISGWVVFKLPCFVVNYVDAFYWPVRHMSTTNLWFWIYQFFWHNFPCFVFVWCVQIKKKSEYNKIVF